MLLSLPNIKPLTFCLLFIIINIFLICLFVVVFFLFCFYILFYHSNIQSTYFLVITSDKLFPEFSFYFINCSFHCFVLWMNSVWHNNRMVGNTIKTITDRNGKLFSFRQPLTSGHTICTSAILNILNRRWAANSLCWLFTWWLIFSKIEVHWAWKYDYFLALIKKNHIQDDKW